MIKFIICNTIFNYFYGMKLTDEYIYRQPEKDQAILLHLISIFKREIPDLEMHFKWGMPYLYYKKRMFCYLISNSKKGFVDAGFARGFQLKKNQDSLVDEKRNTVKSLRYFNLEDIDNAVLEDVIREAASLYK